MTGKRIDLAGIHSFRPGRNKSISSREEADALSLRGLMEVASAWRRGDLYAQLRMMLHHSGRVAPSPIEVRARMRAAVAAWGSAGEDHAFRGYL
jgi:hypothetical protein